MKKLIEHLLSRRKKHPYYDAIFHGSFTEEYKKAEDELHMKKSVWRRDRFFNLLSLLRSTGNVSGEIAECGVYRGLSALLMCRELQKTNDNFKGEGMHLLDSFEGLDATEYEHMFACPLPVVQEYLSEFPKITYHKGHIPETLYKLPEMRYRFVHIDLDLTEPTRASFEYFYPRLEADGMIVCDDYGALIWKDAREVLDDWRRSTHSFTLSTGQLVVTR